jgi:hypothetical protein
MHVSLCHPRFILQLLYNNLKRYVRDHFAVKAHHITTDM